MVILPFIFLFMQIDFLSEFSIERKIFDILSCLISIEINSAKLKNLYGKLALVYWLTQQNSLRSYIDLDYIVYPYWIPMHALGLISSHF